MNADTRIQLRGHCQLCGRLQAVPNGTMSKHGYTVKNGWFQGVCQGDSHAPIEQKRDTADQIIASVRADCAKLREDAAGLKSGKLRPLTAKSDERIKDEKKPMYAWEHVMVPFKDAPAHHQQEARRSAIFAAESRASAGESFADGLEKVCNEFHGKPLVDVTLTKPEPINTGEKRNSHGRVLTARYAEGNRVYFKDDRGYQGWVGLKSWRALTKAAA